MTTIQTRNDAIARVLLWVTVGIVAATAYWYTLPLPNQGAVRGKERNLTSLKREIDQAHKDEKSAEDAAAPQLWTGSVQQIGPQALAAVNALAKANHLKIVAFRPLKPVDAVNVTQIPFSISLDGSYPQTMEFVKQLETPTSRLAVSLVQIAAADASTDHVSGTVNVVAYITEAASAPEPKGGTSAAKS